MEVYKFLNAKILLGSIAIAMFAVAGSSSLANAQQASTVSAVDMQENFIARYESMDKSPAGLAQYKTSITQLQKQAEELNVDRLFSTVTLAHPLSIDKTQEIIDEYGITPKLVYILAEGSGGKLITIGIRPQVSSTQNIADALQIITKDKKIDILGTEAIIGYVDSTEVVAAQTSDDIFLVDISADEHLADNPGNENYMHHFGWDLYHQR